MNRRDFLSETASHVIDSRSSQQKPEPSGINEFANKVLPQFSRTSTGLELYTGPWEFDQAAHLLRRTMFGARLEDINTILAITPEETADLLLADVQLPDPPVNVNSQDTGVPLGQTWVNAPFTDPSNPNYYPDSGRNTSLKAWWVGLMLNQDISLREKMTLFLHNHFVSKSADVNDSRFMYKQQTLLRQHSFGNFKELARLITTDPAMLRFLNGNTNTRTNPNENYARELQELFTIGKGPEIAPGNYTNYTEQDVQAAAKVLTGWRDSRTDINSYFTATRHDPNDKQFSSAYGDTIIAGRADAAGASEIDDLINMIFAQPETAKHICRKLYRWFVYYVIDEAAEANVIVPLADIFRNNNYELKPVLSALFKSAHFFDPANVGCQLKNPVDFTVGVMRQFTVAFPASDNVVTQYAMWDYVRARASSMQMNLCDPPNVAGWPALYQEPQYYQLWINTDTLQRRNQFTDRFIGNTGYTSNDVNIIIDPIAFVEQVSDPSDPNILIHEAARLLFAIPITENQKATLKETLIPGLPDYEWTGEWFDYKNDPTNTMKLSAVKSKLQALLKFMMNMAEYQLL
jgi:uncharacterized protein (DUF1800 family)